MKKWQYVAITILSLLIVGLLILVRWLRPYDIATERAAARAAGIPLTPAEFHRPKPPAAEDAAPDWEALTDLLKKKPLDEALVKNAEAATEPGAKPDAAGTAALRRLVESRPDVLARIHAIVRKPHAYFPHTWEMGDLFPYLTVMRESAKLLQAESLLMARDGRYRDAVENQALAFRIADHAGEDPSTIAYLVANAVEAITLNGLARIMSEAGPDARTAEAVRATLAKSPPHTSIVHGLKGEALMGVNTIRSIGSLQDIGALAGPMPSGPPPPASPPPPGSPAPGPPPLSVPAPPLPSGPPPPPHRPSPLFRHYFAEPSEAVYLHWMTRIVRAAEEPLDRRIAATARVNAELNASLSGYHPSKVLSAIMLPVYAKAVSRGVHTATRRRTLMAATHVMGYRARQGRWPAALRDAMPDPPLDPFTQKPLAYKTDGGGFSITSTAGEDPGKGKPYPNIVFRYPGGFTH